MSVGIGGGHSNTDQVTRYRYVGEVPGQPGQPGYSPLQELMKAAWSRMTGAMGGRDWFKTGWADPKGRFGGSGGGYQTPATPATGGQGGQGSTGTPATPPTEAGYTPGQTPATPATGGQGGQGSTGTPATPAPPDGGGPTRPPSGSAVPEPGEQPGPPGYNPPRYGKPPDTRNPQSTATSTTAADDAGGEWNPLNQGKGKQRSAEPGFGENVVDWGYGPGHAGKPPDTKDGVAEGDTWTSPDGRRWTYTGGKWVNADGGVWNGNSGGGGGGSGDNDGSDGGGGVETDNEDGPGKTPDTRNPDAPPVDPGSGYYYPWSGVPPAWSGPGGGAPQGGENGIGGLVGYYMNELGSNGYDPEVANALRNSTMGAVGNQANAARRDMARRVAATGNDAGYFGAAADVAGTAAAQTEEAARQNILANEQERARRNAIGIGGMQTLSDQEREDEQLWARLFAGLATKPRDVEGEQSGTNINFGFGF